MDFKEIFNNVSEKEKADYLFHLLNKDEKLKKDFLNKISINSDTNNINTNSYKDFTELVLDSYGEFMSEMESLDLEETDWENYSPPHGGYVPEWEAEQDMAEQEADELFGYMKENCISLLFKDQLDNLLAELVAFYFASKNAHINDPNDNLGDANDYFVNMHKDFLDYTVEKISISTINDSALINSIKLFFKYFEIEKKDFAVDIKPFEELLLVLLNSVTNIEDIKQLINITNIDKKYFAQYSLQLEKRLGNKASWLEHATQFYLIDEKVGYELLEHYHKEDIVKYISTAKKLFYKDKWFWAEKIALKLEIETDKNLYKEVYTQLCKSNNQIADYKKIKGILTEKEKENLHNELNGDNVFRVEIYAEEKQYKKIKDLVEKDIDSYAFNRLISPILTVYPEFCFTIIEKKAITAIKNERGRSAYSKIASWLNQAQKISGMDNKTQNLISRIYNNKPNLPALKDEFRLAGIVKV